jgi:hypothetical protein
MINKFFTIFAGIFTFLLGFFTSKKISDAEILKQQVKQYEEKEKQREKLDKIITDANSVSSYDKRLWLKKQRETSNNNK